MGLTKGNPITAIVLPSSDDLKKLPKFTEALAILDNLNAEMTEIEAQAKELKVIDAESFKVAGALTARRKALKKAAEEAVAPYKAPLRKWLDFVQQQYNVVSNHDEQMASVLSPKMELYVREEERKAKDEAARKQREINDQLAREAEEKRQADIEAAKEAKRKKVALIKADFAAGKIGKREYAKQLKEAGEEAEAAKEQAELDAEERKNVKVTVTVEPNIPTMKGVVKRTNYTAHCTNQDGFILAALAEFQTLGHFGIYREFIEVNDDLLAKHAREVVKDDALMEKKFQFVSAKSKKTF